MVTANQFMQAISWEDISKNKNSYPRGKNTVWFDRQVPKIWKNLLPHSS
jgi:hypothetical protein